MEHDNMEHKTLPFQIIDDGGESDQHVIKGFAAVMGNIDSGGDRIHNGAFMKTISEMGSRIKAGWQHDLDHPLGPSTVIKEVGVTELPPELLARAPTATGGLYVECALVPTATNLDRLMLIKGHAVDELSIGYCATKWSYVANQDNSGWDGSRIRDIFEIELFEWSMVTLGMNQAAIAVGAKNINGGGQVYTFEELKSQTPEEVATNIGETVKARIDKILEEKAGAVLSRANADRITKAIDDIASATDTLEQVLVNAGVIPADEDENTDEADTAKSVTYARRGNDYRGWLAIRGFRIGD